MTRAAAEHVLTEARRESLRREARRVYERYAVEFVEALDLCPWAERARREGRVKLEIVLDEDPAEVLEAFAADPAIDVGLIALPLRSTPLADNGKADFDRFVAKLRDAHATANRGRTVMALAGFHPEAEPVLGKPAQLVPFIRRSPDPTIQCVRLDMLAEMRRGTDSGTDFIDLSKVDLQALLAKKRRPPLHERVAEKNLTTLTELGLARAEAILADIHADRARTYEALLGR